MILLVLTQTFRVRWKTSIAVGLLTMHPDSVKLTDIALTPFHSNNMANLYTSRTARSTRTFGYTYPELIDWGINATQLASNARAALNNLYSSDSTLAHRSRRSSPALQPAWADTNYQYFLNIKINSSEITEPLLIHVFIGEIPSSPGNWGTTESLAGSFAAMSHTDSVMVGQVALTHRLNDLIMDLRPNSVIPYLRSQLAYRIQRLDDCPLDDHEIPGSLKIAVVGQQILSSVASDHFPYYGPFLEYPDATKNLIGSLTDGEQM